MAEFPFNLLIRSSSLTETEQIAAEFYRQIAPTAVVALYGPLGSGKTSFVRGVAMAAGIERKEISSPSFTLINEYLGGATPIYHFDLYRFKSPAEFYSIGGDEYLLREGIILIEWADHGGDFIPRRRFEAHFSIINDATREFLFRKEAP